MQMTALRAKKIQSFLSGTINQSISITAFTLRI